MEGISVKDIAWAAGIFEGEGCFTSRSTNDGTVSVGQKDRWLCDKLESLFGGSVKNYTANGSPYFYWRVNGVQCREFLLTIFSLLSPRKKAKILQARPFFTEAVKVDGFCKNGHEYTKDNTSWAFRGMVKHKQCLTCSQAKLERRKQSKLRVS